jgi:hypothetical protein
MAAGGRGIRAAASSRPTGVLPRSGRESRPLRVQW